MPVAAIGPMVAWQACNWTCDVPAVVTFLAAARIERRSRLEESIGEGYLQLMDDRAFVFLALPVVGYLIALAATTYARAVIPKRRLPEALPNASKTDDAGPGRVIRQAEIEAFIALEKARKSVTTARNQSTRPRA